MPHSCTIQRHHALEIRWPGLLLQAAFCDAVKPRGCISWPVWPLRGINKIAWGAKLILTADLVSCASLVHLLMAQHCYLCLNVCFSPPTTPHSCPPHPPPTGPPSMDSIHFITDVGKTTSKTKGVQIACRISYEILAI